MTPTTPALRVCHVITDIDIGGAELMLARLVGQAAADHVENTVVVLGARGPLAERIESTGAHVVALEMRRDRPDPRALLRLVLLLRRIRPSLVQTWLYHADFAGLLAAKLAGVPVVWNIRCAELDPRDHPASLSFLLRALALASRYPAAVICNSIAGQQAHERLGYTPRRWEIIPNGFDVDAFRPDSQARISLRRELGIEPDVKLVGLLARLHPMKDHRTFLKAGARVISRMPDVHVVAAGRGVNTASELSAQLDASGMGGRVHLLPEQRDAARFLAALDVAVSSSYSEAFPNVIGEAMACATPCVATDVGESAHLVADTGLIAPARDSDALAEAIQNILERDERSRTELGRRARARIVAEYSIAAAGARYRSLWDEVAGGSTKGDAQYVRNSRHSAY